MSKDQIGWEKVTVTHIDGKVYSVKREPIILEVGTEVKAGETYLVPASKPEHEGKMMLISNHTNSQGELTTIETVDSGQFQGQLLLIIHDNNGSATKAPTLLDQGLAEFLRAQLDILFPRPSPCQEKGYKIGDEFQLMRDLCGIARGQVVQLAFDDGTDSPLFRMPDAGLDYLPLTYLTKEKTA